MATASTALSVITVKRTPLVMVAIVAILSVLIAVAGCGTGTPKALGTWVDQTYEPAMQSIHDPALAVWQPDAAPAEAVADSCVEALARHDEWDERLLQAPDKTLKGKVADYIDAERAALAMCAETAERPAGADDSLGPVVEQLKRMGVRFPEG